MGRSEVPATGAGDLNVRIRRYRREDAEACHAVFFAAVREGAARFYSPEQRAAWAPSAQVPAGWAGRLSAQAVWVAEDGGAVVGFFALTPGGHLDLAFVRPERMGRGVAAALHDALVLWARESGGLSRLTTHASHFLRPFLGRRGWRVIRPETTTRDGQKLQRFRMEVALGEPA